MATTASPGPGAGTRISSSVTGAPLLLDTTPRTVAAITPRPREGRSRRLLENVDPTGGAQPDDVGQAHPGPLDLAVARPAAQGGGDLPDVANARRRDRAAL